MFRLDVEIDGLDRLEGKAREAMMFAARVAVEQAAILAERELESLTRSHVPGKAYRAWQRKVYPVRGRLTDSPHAIVYASGGSRTRGLFSYYTTPGTNRAKGGQWLAIPTAAAGNRGRKRDLTPQEWENSTGIKLQFAWLNERQSVAGLFAVGMLDRNGGGALRRSTRARRANDARAGVHRATVRELIFTLIRQQPHANSFAIAPALERARAHIRSTLLTEASKIDVR